MRPPRPDESACGRGAAYNPVGNGRLSTPLAHRSTQLGSRKGRELVDAPTLVRRPLQQPFVAPGVESAQQRQLPRRATHLGKQAQHHRAAVSSSERKGLPVSDHVRQLLPKGLSLAGPRACVGGPGGRAAPGYTRMAPSRVGARREGCTFGEGRSGHGARSLKRGTCATIPQATPSLLAGTAAALSDRLGVAATVGAVQQVHVVAGMLAV